MYGLAVADHHALADQRVARSRSSSTAGATFLPPAVTMSSFFRPVTLQEPLVVQFAQVPGVQPPLGGQDLGASPRRCASSRGTRSGPGSGSRRRRRSARSTPGSGGPTVPILFAAGPVDRGRRRRLGQPVALQDRDARAAEEVAEPLAERRRRRTPRTGPSRRPRPGACRRRAGRTARGQPQPQPRLRRGGCRRDCRAPGSRRRLSPAAASKMPALDPARRTPAAQRCCRPSRTPGARPAGTWAGTRAGLGQCLAVGPVAQHRRPTPGSRPG